MSKTVYDHADICLYNEDAWEKFMDARGQKLSCSEVQNLATWQRKITFPPEQEVLEFDMLVVPPETPKGSSHYYYIVALDCESEGLPELKFNGEDGIVMDDDDFDPSSIKQFVPVQFHLEILNGGSHLPADEDGMIYVHSVGALFALLGFWMFTSAAQTAEQRTGSIHMIVVFVGAAWLLQVIDLYCTDY